MLASPHELAIAFSCSASYKPAMARPIRSIVTTLVSCIRNAAALALARAIVVVALAAMPSAIT